MRSAEIRDLAGLAGAGIARPGAIAKGIHEAVAGRTFRALGILGAPVRLVHDAIAGRMYTSVGSTLRLAPRAGGAAVARLAPPDAAAIGEGRYGAMALGALNGAFGDRLARDHPDLDVGLGLRRRGREVAADAASLADAYPDATPSLAVFAHGLCESEEAWSLGFGRAAGRPSYGARLRQDLGYTPLYIRYNTGLHVSDNGHRLSELLEQVVAAWPVEIARIAIVGHSMGGLVARSACHHGGLADYEWTRRVRHVFCLGTPHLGAPLEKAANVAGSALRQLPETWPFAELVNARSAGIKDLRFGSCVEEDWCDCDPDEFLRDRCNEVPFLDCVTYCFVGATLTRDHDHPLGSLLGDMLVRFPSASGRGRHRCIPFEIGHHVGGANHLQLLNHPAVYDQIRAWVEDDQPRELPPGSAAISGSAGGSGL
jgi:pimeloyl-ACP methyl ester carboxylesterase